MTTAVQAKPTTNAPALMGERRPSPALMKYYALESLLAGPGIVILLPLRYFRYRTLRYVFDDQGVTVRWGVLFRREVSLTYARIQDIHLVSNVFERWMGLGRVQVQTASGQSGAELTIEGLPDYEDVRDELYKRMRGARADKKPGSLAAAPTYPALTSETGHDAVVAALNAAAAELRALREDLAWDPRP